MASPTSPTTALARTTRPNRGLGKPAIPDDKVERWKSAMQQKGEKEIAEDKVGFLTDPGASGRSVFKVKPGDVVRARVTVSTSGDFYTKLSLYPSKGDGPIYDKGASSDWVQGKNITLRQQLTIQDGMKYVSVQLDQPNWTKDQLPEDVDARTFPKKQQTGTVSWKNAKITVNKPLPGGSLVSGVSNTTLAVGGGALAAGALYMLAG
jgi:hypothetical protein